MADVAQLGLEINSSQAKSAAVDLDKLAASAKGAEQATERLASSGPKLSAVGTGAAAAGDGIKVASFQTANLAAQIQDIAVQLQAGQNPFQIALQQGTQINQVIGQQGAAGAVKMLGAAFTSLINPVSLSTIAIIALAGSIPTVWNAIAGRGEADAEQALERQKSLVDDLAKSYPQLAKSIKEYQDEAGRATPNQIVVATQTQITAAQGSIARLTDQIRGAIGGMTDLSGEFSRGLFLDPKVLDQLVTLNSEFTSGQLSAEQLRDALAGLELNGQLTSDTQAEIDKIIDLTTQLGKAQATAQGFADVMTALKNSGGLIIGGDFNALPGTGDLEKTLRSAISSTQTPQQRLTDQFNQQIGGATSNEDRDRLTALYNIALGDLNAKDAARTAGRQLRQSPFEQAVQSGQQDVATLKAQSEALGATGKQAAFLEEQTRLLNEAREHGQKLSPEQLAQIDQISEAYAEQKDQLQQLTELYDTGQRATEDFAATFKSSFTDSITKWQTDKNSFVQQLTDAVKSGTGTLSDSQQQLISSMGATGDQLKTIQDLASSVTAAGTKLTDQQTASIDALASSLADAKDGASALGRVWDSVWTAMGAASSKVLDDIANKALQMAADGIWDSIFGGLTNSGGGGGGSGIGSFLSSIFHFASGTMSAPGGLSLVGENGPELVDLPAGAKVYNNQQTSQMMGGGQQIVQVIDQRNSGSIQQQQSTGPNGEKVLRLLVRDEVTQARRRGAAGFAF